tara:strand:- start:2307 stop:2498 length:192 start_codon:yes stop_codon:yes gene_type:complete
MKYEKIKKTLQKQIDNNEKAYWTYIKENKEFVCLNDINVGKKIKVYTPEQLLTYINDILLQDL